MSASLQLSLKTLVYLAKREGYSVVFTNKLPKDADGDYDIEAKRIRVSSKASTLKQLCVLAHEFFGHADQFRHIFTYGLKVSKHTLDQCLTVRARNKYRRNVELSRIYKKYLTIEQILLLPDTKENLDVVEFCETDASRRALKELEHIMTKEDYSHLLSVAPKMLNELDPSAVKEWLREQWRKNYLDIGGKKRKKLDKEIEAISDKHFEELELIEKAGETESQKDTGETIIPIAGA
jgi:hypothetical protein